MDGPIGYYANELSQTVKDKYHLVLFICGINKNIINKQTDSWKQRPNG